MSYNIQALRTMARVVFHAGQRGELRYTQFIHAMTLRTGLPGPVIENFVRGLAV